MGVEGQGQEAYLRGGAQFSVIVWDPGGYPGELFAFYFALPSGFTIKIFFFFLSNFFDNEKGPFYGPEIRIGCLSAWKWTFILKSAPGSCSILAADPTPDLLYCERKVEYRSGVRVDAIKPLGRFFETKQVLRRCR